MMLDLEKIDQIYLVKLVLTFWVVFKETSLVCQSQKSKLHPWPHKNFLKWSFLIASELKQSLPIQIVKNIGTGKMQP